MLKNAGMIAFAGIIPWHLREPVLLPGQAPALLPDWAALHERGRARRSRRQLRGRAGQPWLAPRPVASQKLSAMYPC